MYVLVCPILTITEPKKVRRSLFTRSHSVTSDIGHKSLGDNLGRTKRSRGMFKYGLT